MKKYILILLIGLYSSLTFTKAQTATRSEKIGHVFTITVPDYMTRTLGINDAASVQYKNVVKDVYSFVIEDSKSDLELVDMKFSTVEEFYEDFIKDFLKDTKDRVISPPKSLTVDGVKFVQTDASYYDKEAKAKIYYNITIAETKDYFYKILSYTDNENKLKLKDDLCKLGISIRD